MKKLFISQPMNRKSDEEILREREEAIAKAKEVCREDVEVIDSFFQSAPADARPLWFLGKSLELLSTADIAYFAPGWDKARGCKIEHECAEKYGICTIESNVKYENIYDYIAKNMDSMHGDFYVAVTDISEKEPDMLLLTIHPADRDGDTADFYLHADGREEYTTSV